MAGVDLGANAGGRRRTLDSEVNMIPMIDLLIVTISFLLITAVWTHMARLDASAQTRGGNEPCADGKCDPPRALHVDMRTPDRFVLSWRAGTAIISSIDVPRRPVTTSEGTVRFPDLAEAVKQEWAGYAVHRDPTDYASDRAVLHTTNDARYQEMIAAIDAIDSVRKPPQRQGSSGAISGSRASAEPSFTITLATN
jgi:hypothetical protein